MDKEHTELGVLIADRLTFFRHGLLALLRDRGPVWQLSEAASFAEMLEHLHANHTTLVLVDLQLPGMERANGVRRLRELFPERSFVVLADEDDRATILECLTAGAQGYVLKSATPTQFIRAIETILCGGVFAPASLTNPAPVHVPTPRLYADAGNNKMLTQLTDRQRAVFALLAEGCATKEIARRLNLAIGTVKVHLAAIYRTLGARSRLEAVSKAAGGFTLPATLMTMPVRAAERLN